MVVARELRANINVQSRRWLWPSLLIADAINMRAQIHHGYTCITCRHFVHYWLLETPSLCSGNSCSLAIVAEGVKGCAVGFNPACLVNCSRPSCPYAVILGGRQAEPLHAPAKENRWYRGKCR